MSDDETGDVIILEQRETSVFEDPHGRIIIQQGRTWNDDEEPFLRFSPESLPALISALKRHVPGRRK